MDYNKIPCGGFYFDPSTLRFDAINGDPVLTVIGGVTIEPEQLDTSVFVRKDGAKMAGPIDMDGYPIVDTELSATQVTVTDENKEIAIHLKTTDDGELSITKEDGTTGEQLPYAPVLVGTPTNDNHAVTRQYADAKYGSVISESGEVLKNIDVASNQLLNVERLTTDGAVKVFLGSVIEPVGTQGVRLTATTDGALAVLQPDTQATYSPVYVATPMASYQAANKGYVDGVVPLAVSQYLNSNEGKLLISNIIAEYLAEHG